MRYRGLIWGSILTVMFFIVYAGISQASEESGKRGHVAGVSPEVVADYIHAVIEADRTLYTTHVVHRMQESGLSLQRKAGNSGEPFRFPLRCCCSPGFMSKSEGPG